LPDGCEPRTGGAVENGGFAVVKTNVTVVDVGQKQSGKEMFAELCFSGCTECAPARERESLFGLKLYEFLSPDCPSPTRSSPPRTERDGGRPSREECPAPQFQRPCEVAAIHREDVRELLD